MKYQLKLARFSLAQQSRLLKKLEKSKSVKNRGLIHSARTVALRSEARSQNIAYGFLRGCTMNQMELPLRPLDKGHISSRGLTRTAPNWDRVLEIVREYGSTYFEQDHDLRQKFAEFTDEWDIGTV